MSVDNNEGQPKEKRKVEFRQPRIFQLWDELEQRIKARGKLDLLLK